jgi:hypothetical protein
MRQGAFVALGYSALWPRWAQNSLTTVPMS